MGFTAHGRVLLDLERGVRTLEDVADVADVVGSFPSAAEKTFGTSWRWRFSSRVKEVSVTSWCRSVGHGRRTI